MNPLPAVQELFFIGKFMVMLVQTGITSRCSISPYTEHIDVMNRKVLLQYSPETSCIQNTGQLRYHPRIVFNRHAAKKQHYLQCRILTILFHRELIFIRVTDQ